MLRDIYGRPIFCEGFDSDTKSECDSLDVHLVLIPTRLSYDDGALFGTIDAEMMLCNVHAIEYLALADA